jgi:hypothetical protein
MEEPDVPTIIPNGRYLFEAPSPAIAGFYGTDIIHYANVPYMCLKSFITHTNLS